jgi:hypothetical protein
MIMALTTEKNGSMLHMMSTILQQRDIADWRNIVISYSG